MPVVSVRVHLLQLPGSSVALVAEGRLDGWAVVDPAEEPASHLRLVPMCNAPEGQVIGRRSPAAAEGEQEDEGNEEATQALEGTASGDAKHLEDLVQPQELQVHPATQDGHPST